MSTMTTTTPAPRAKPVHPFHGAVRRPPTARHTPVVFECMLGTVYAVAPDGTVRYFDYDWDGARAFARVADASDLRVARASDHRNGQWSWCALPGTLGRRQFALWVVRP